MTPEVAVNVNKTLHGFKLLREETVEEINSHALLFEHERSGAELIVLENDDDNKSFSITFRTPPEDDYGTAHILEHSVLCGSRKFPVKEPFIELVKGSLQTFLNAMTFADKTMYPLASRNSKDFFNLMDVYLDAVFFPRITEEIFMQEGWRRDLESLESNAVYKGVVFNEMKGVFSSPESIIDRYQAHAMFPSTTYGYESGGDPEQIPQLTYENFLAFHKRHYHPSNGRIMIYGDGSTPDYLKFLDENYLKEFTKRAADSDIQIQRRFSKPKRKVVFYPVSKNESLDKKTYVSVALKLHRATDHEHCMAFHILSHILLGTQASPLRKALIDSELGSEVIGGGFDDYRMETLFAVGLKGTDEEDEEKILALIDSTLRDLGENGIEEDMIAAAINTVDFKLREANFGGFPKGLVYNIQSLSSWLYDGDPISPLRYEKVMAKIKRGAKKGYFEKLIRKYLLDNNHRVVVVGLPKPGLTEKQDGKTRKKMREFKSSLSNEEAERLVGRTQALQEAQAAPDRPEDLAKLPKLELTDINRESQSFPIEEKAPSAPRILFHDLFANKIAYFKVGFDTGAVDYEQLQYLPMIGSMILGMGTNQRSYVQMSQLIGIHTGGVHASHFSSAPLEDRERIISYKFFNGKAELNKVGNLLDIFSELLTEFNFNNHKRLLEIVRSAKADMEESIVPGGNQYVLSRLQSYYSRLGRFDELTDGVAYYRFLEDLLKRAEKDPGEVAEAFRKVAECLFNRNNLVIDVTASAQDYAKFEKKLSAFAKGFTIREQSPARLEFKPPAFNEAFVTSSRVQYVGKAVNFYDLGFEYTGKFDVLRSLLGSAYLWDRVRMQGGAYGCSASFDRNTGDFALVSYRDPNLTETLERYDQIADYLANLELSQDELTKLIIGCVGRLDPPLTPDRKGSIAMVESFIGVTREIKQKRRDELLSTRLEDLRAFAPLFQKLKEEGKICVLGSEAKIKKEGKQFEHLITVFE